MENNQDKIKYSLLFFLLVLLDQASKAYVLKNISRLIFRNYNFAFSLVLPKPLIYLVYLALLSALVYWFVRKSEKTKTQYLSFVLIFAGALSNILERLHQGYVIDFIHIHTGVLNLADFYILAGIGMLIFI
jgi:signal peptidase II